MKNQVLLQAANYLRTHRRKKAWYRVVTCLAAVVVFCTTYALILPAITMEKEPICGIEAHTHDEACFLAPETILECALQIHSHTDSCYDTEGTFICEDADYVIHSHTDACYDSEGALVCTLQEVLSHIHTDDCYTVPADSHVHSADTCYETTQSMICVLEETEGHVHADTCYGTVVTEVCGKTDHLHTDSCYTDVTSYICGQEQSDGHQHSDACYHTESSCICEIADHEHDASCYQDVTTCVCGQEESEGHQHTESCAVTERVSACTQEEHTHADTCYGETKVLECGREEVEAHSHSDSCYASVETLICAETEAEPVLVCTRQEICVHQHSESCYDKNGALVCGLLNTVEHVHDENCLTPADPEAEPVLTCTLEEHVHDEVLCYIDETADVETEDDWKKTLPETLDGDTYAEDLIAVAESQLDYAESSRNVQVDPDGRIWGYTRYGAWYGEPYGEWNTMFVSFCLHYTGIEEVTAEASAYRMVQDLKEASLFLEEHTPQPGDLMFLTDDEDENADRVGIIVSVTEEEIRTIEGDTENNCVEYQTYEPGDESILGYYVLPVKEASEETPEVIYYCGLTAHTHDDYCYDTAGTMTCELTEHTHTDECLTETVYYCGKEVHVHDETCLDENGQQICGREEHSHTEDCTRKPVIYYCGLEEHTHGDTCCDENGDLICGLEEHAHSEECLIAPAAYYCGLEEHAHAEECFDADGNVICGREEHTHTIACSADLTALSEDDRAAVTRVILLIEEMPSADEIDAKIAEFEAVEDYDGEEAWLTEVYQQVNDIYVAYYKLGVYLHPYVVNAEKLLELEYIWSMATLYNSITSDAPTKSWYTSTKDFIELNLYDYNGYVNTNYWTKNNWYPGFQWNGGAYAKTDYKYAYASADDGIPNYVTDRNYIDSIDFGNSLITNLTYGNTSDYAKSVNATAVGYANHSNTHPINWLYGNSTEGYTNKPIGYSTTDLTESQNVMKYTLVDGYPALTDGTMLDYLFKDGTPATKLNTQSIDGLFQQDPVTGEYEYNSRLNHAEYTNNFFQLYDEIITPNFITYPFGNFLPLNSISDLTKATQVGSFNYSGGMYDYVERIIDDLENDTEGLGSYWYETQSQLVTMLQEYRENWTIYPRTINNTSNKWTNLSPANAIRDYFWGDTDGEGDHPTDSTSFITQDFLDRMYNIDWDVQTNFFFGMEMKMNFMQPKNGLTGNDNDGDGIFDYPMHFYFTGDDDVWVYIDGALFLDLSGIHRHVGGEIDFVEGKVHYYALDTSIGDVSSTPYKTFTFAEILTAAGMSTDGLNSNGTFADYSTHEFKFFYMERGSGSSVCRLNFNFPLLRQNTLSIEKELSDDSDSIEAIGNPDFTFQVLDVVNGEKTENPFFAYDETGTQWAYSLYDVDGSVIQEVRVTSKNDDGTVKSLEVVNAEGKVVREEVDGKITNYPENGEVLTIDANGCFTMKAGQRAEFVGIPESWGQYYVRELLTGIDASQYETVYVSGVATTLETVNVGGETFQGAESPILDMSSGSSTFLFENRITTKKLGQLSVTKKLELGNMEYDDETKFKLYVTLDDESLPSGTTYTVTDADGNVLRTATVGIEEDTKLSYIELAAGETATISNILSGSVYKVWEADSSAADFTVGYTADGTILENTSTHISGEVQTSTTVSVIVTNTLSADEVEIPVTKAFSSDPHDGIERTYTFNLVQVDESGAVIEGGYSDELTLTLASDKDSESVSAAGGKFVLTYLSSSFQEEDAETVFYYKITEASTADEDDLENTQSYIVQVTIDKTKSPIEASYKLLDSAGDEVTDLTAAFVNTITGDLTLTKQVEGVNNNQLFGFIIKLGAGTSGVDPLPTSYKATAYNPDGTWQQDMTLEFGADYEYHLGFAHGEKLVIHDIPIGAEWTISEVTAILNEEGKFTGVGETAPDGYIIGITIGGTVTEGTTNTSTGSIVTGETDVVYTNTSTYALPETGGAGTIPYTMAGLMLMLFSAAYLLYRTKKRGREVY